VFSLRYELVFLRNYENEELQDNDQEQENKKKKNKLHVCMTSVNNLTFLLWNRLFASDHCH